MTILTFVIMFIAGSNSNSLIDLVRGEETSYTITLNADNAPASLSTSAFESGTGSARYVNFDYTSAKRTTGYHVVLDANGLITNNGETRITSIKSLTAIFSGGIATLKTGWLALPTANEQTLTSDTAVTFTNNPYFFSITNTGVGELSLESLEITYSCIPGETIGSETHFGMYPQSKVTDSALISTLNSDAGTLPTSENSQSWTDYGYYISGSVSSYMWYIDLVNQNNEYRGVYFTSYRPNSTTAVSSTANSLQDDNGFATSTVYWFKYEPIAWRVLDNQNEKAFLMADLLLDSQDYYYSTANRTIDSTVYPNNYQYSHIRSWLNDNFYNTAFSAEEKALVQTTTVDNSVASTGYISNTYACANTNDKVFLLSYVEANSSSYGLNTAASRQLQPSAYSLAQGAYTNANTFGPCWLRSPNRDNTKYVRFVDSVGNIDNSDVYYTYRGVAPSLWISL